jgi:hypothetical protein
VKTTYYIVYLEDAIKEDIELYYIGTKDTKAKAVYKENLAGFLDRRLEDAVFSLASVDLSTDEVKLLKLEFNTGRYTKNIYDLLGVLQYDPTYNELCYEADFSNVIIFYCDSNSLYFNDYEYYRTVDHMFDVEAVRRSAIKDYIEHNYYLF